MIVLDNAGTRALSLINTQNGANVEVCFSDYTTSTGAYARGVPTLTTISSATTTSICATPASGVIRDVDYVNIYNTYAGSQTFTVQITSGSGGPFVLVYATLAQNESLNYTHGSGWCALDANGNRKQVTSSVFSSITDTGLTSGRVTYAGTNGLLQDSANLTFNGTTLTANTIGAFTLGGTIAGGGNQINNIIIGNSTPLAGSFTTINVSGTISSTKNGQGFSQVVSSGQNALVEVGDGTNTLRMWHTTGNLLQFGSVGATSWDLIYNGGTAIASVLSSGFVAGADNSYTLGNGSFRWSTVYAATGAINTSDGREKTAVSPMTSAEINASKQLAREIGIYKWLSAVAEKGAAARKHVGFTVQRAIEIMESNGLDPMSYGFICYDQWDDKFVEHPAIEAKDAVLDEDGNVIEAAIGAKAARTEQTQHAGDRYAFRYDELNMFIARGFDARLSVLEAANV